MHHQVTMDLLDPQDAEGRASILRTRLVLPHLSVTEHRRTPERKKTVEEPHRRPTARLSMVLVINGASSQKLTYKERFMWREATRLAAIAWASVSTASGR